MAINLLDRVGDWNPQLFRELKGRFNSWKARAAIVASLLGQFILFISLTQNRCLNYTDGICTQSEWHIYWQIMFRSLDWILPIILLLAGVYGLVSDFATEERKGTLNFIRLAPQTSQSILIGKILGVPALFYLIIALAIPLHFISGLIAGVPAIWLLGIYGLWIAGASIFYTFFLFYTLQHSLKVEAKAIAGGASFIAFWFAFFYIGAVDFTLDWYRETDFIQTWQWFLLPVGKYPILLYGLVLVGIGIGNYFFWQAINRRFNNPKSTLLSKEQSYYWFAILQIWMLGFAFSQSRTEAQHVLGFGVLFFINPILFLILNIALLPNRQSLIDWTRYRRTSKLALRRFWKSYLVKDLIWDDRSPAVIAIAMNYLMMSIIWLPWILLWLRKSWVEGMQIVLVLVGGLVLTFNVILIYALLIEVLRLLKVEQRILIGLAMLGLVLFPIFSREIFGSGLLMLKLLLVITPFPVGILTFQSIFIIGFGFLTQVVILGALTQQLTQKLQTLGESTSKHIVAG
ncbi:MAG TPA: hypothetical protein V6D28_07565 [Leptolyngbyaceae cyanobacterium]